MQYLNLEAIKEVVLTVHEGPPLYLRRILGPSPELYVVEHASVLGETRIVETEQGKILEPVRLMVGDRLRVRRTPGTPEDVRVLLDLGRDFRSASTKFVAFGAGGARVCETYEG